MVSFGQSWPKLMDIAGDKVVRAMDWPGAEEIAERIAKTIPPDLLDEKERKTPQIPPEVMQIMQQAQGHIQELEAALQDAEQGIELSLIHISATIRRGGMAGDSTAKQKDGPLATRARPSVTSSLKSC